MDDHAKVKNKHKRERIDVACACGARLKAPRKAAGKRVKCPRCKKFLIVPAPGSPLDHMLSALGDGEHNSPALEEQPPAPEPVRTETGKLCPMCNGEMPAEAVFCVKCGYHLERGTQSATSGGGGGGLRSRTAAAGGPGLVGFLTSEPTRMMDPPDWKIGLAACVIITVVASFVTGEVSGSAAAIGGALSTIPWLVAGAISAAILMLAYKVATKHGLEFSTAMGVQMALMAALILLNQVVSFVLPPADDGEEALNVVPLLIALGINVFFTILAYRMFLALSWLKSAAIVGVQLAIQAALLVGLMMALAALMATTGGADIPN